jgi:hypothetical protein
LAKKWTHKACFEHYGTKPANPRWSWSGRSDDGKTVSVTFWQDRFEGGTTLYRSHVHLSDDKWFGSPGHAELIRNLAWARDHCDGLVRVIIAIPRDRDVSPRSIKECFPQPNLIMRVTQLDAATGDFVVERVA